MPRNSEQKIKLLVLYELLKTETDEAHPLTTKELIAALGGYGIEVTRKTLYEDIDLLIRYGYDIVCEKGRNNRYYVGGHDFERPEIEVLLNAVSASKLLTQAKSETLSEKLAELLGKPQGEELKSIVGAPTAKNGNERIYYTIDAVTDALLSKRKLSFLYFDRRPQGGKQYRKNGERYEVNPLGMIYSGDNFYLVCFHDKYKDAAHYRIDKMDDARPEKERITELEQYRSFDIAAYRNELFSMYAGERMEVRLTFPSEFSSAVTERFGEDIPVLTEKAGEYAAEVAVRVSKAFFSWLTLFEGGVRIVAPESEKNKYIAFLRNLTEKA